MATTTATVSISSSDLIPGSALSINASSTLMKAGLTTGPQGLRAYLNKYYVDWGIHETMIGRLYAGDWMFIPWNASDDDAAIELEAQVAAQTIEYAFFNSNFVLTADAG